MIKTKLLKSLSFLEVPEESENTSSFFKILLVYLKFEIIFAAAYGDMVP